MIQQLIDKSLDNQIRDKKMKENDREIYRYGYRMLLLEVVNVVILILIGLLFHCLVYMALFAVVYIPLRSYAGGYHASTPIGCTVFSAILEIVIAVSLRFSWYDILLPEMYFVALAAQIFIWFRSPVAAVHKPIEDGQKQKFRRRTRMILLTETAVMVLCIKNHISIAGYIVGISHIILSVLMLLPQKE